MFKTKGPWERGISNEEHARRTSIYWRRERQKEILKLTAMMTAFWVAVLTYFGGGAAAIIYLANTGQILYTIGVIIALILIASFVWAMQNA